MATIALITPDDAAATLDGGEYGEEGSQDLFARMKDAGLVAVFGASDDLVEFRGAIYKEIGAYDGATAYVTSEGLLINECEDEGCPYFARLRKRASTIEADWSTSGFSWFIKAEFPHRTFSINEDGEPYCRGIVFALADVPS